MGEPTTYVGIDAHKRDLHLAMVIGDATEVISWSAPADHDGIERVRRKLERATAGLIECCYEAGPGGYALQRRLERGRVRCRVIAPSLIPRKPGDRVKTNRRDARQLALLLRANLLTTVHVPTEAEEAVRDLARARDDARRDLMRARHRLTKLLLRRGLVYPGTHWTLAHRAWVQQRSWTHAADRYVMTDYRAAIDQVETRLTELDRLLAEIATAPPYGTAVAALRCLRGIDTVSAIMLLAELHDIRRFAHPRALMAFTGLVPSEASTGDAHCRGKITKTGNTQLRRLLIEAAWHYRHEPRPSRRLRQRRRDQPLGVLTIATRAEHRLCRRYRRLSARLKPKPLVTTAVARELVGFIWATLQLPEVQMR
jgi:transposase